MHFCLLTRFQSHHSGSSFVRRLLAEASAAGHHFTFINPAELTLSFGGRPGTQGAIPSSPVNWHGRPFPEVLQQSGQACELIHYALRWDDDHTWQILETLRDWGYPVLPPHRVPLGDSVTMARLFARAGVRTPRTWVLANADQMPMILPELPFPCVFRVRKGMQGRHLYQANHSGEALAIAENLSNHGFSFMVQEVLAPTGFDVRAMIVGKRVIAAVERIAATSYLRPSEDGNIRVQPTTLSSSEIQLVQTVARLHNAPYAAINFLRRENAEPVLLEVSRAPVLTEVENTTGANVAAAIIAHLELCARQHRASAAGGKR